MGLCRFCSRLTTRSSDLPPHTHTQTHPPTLSSPPPTPTPWACQTPSVLTPTCCRSFCGQPHSGLLTYPLPIRQAGLTPSDTHPINTPTVLATSSFGCTAVAPPSRQPAVSRACSSVHNNFWRRCLLFYTWDPCRPPCPPHPRALWARTQGVRLGLGYYPPCTGAAGAFRGTAAPPRRLILQSRGLFIPERTPLNPYAHSAHAQIHPHIAHSCIGAPEGQAFRVHPP